MNQHGHRRIKAVTEPITLEEVELGRFSVELDLHRFSTRCTSACFDCKAQFILEMVPRTEGANSASITDSEV